MPVRLARTMLALVAVVQGADGTPYAGGHFRLQLSVPARYPFEPPKVQFVTPIYHPNIDSAGRICLDILNLPPKGAWKPSLNISTVLASLQLLMSEPNADDGLMVDITHQYTHDHARFERTAIEHTKRYATTAGTAIDASAPASSAPAGEPSSTCAASGAPGSSDNKPAPVSTSTSGSMSTSTSALESEVSAARSPRDEAPKRQKM